MRLLPKDKVGRISFCEAHAPTWTERAAEIGASPELVALLADQTAEARLALKAQLQAQQAARAATQRLNNAIRKMSKIAAAVVLQVRAKANHVGNGVYPLAGIPKIAKKSPIAPPGTPSNFKATLQTLGWIKLEWTCRNPIGSTGTAYHLWRQIDRGPMTYLGVFGRKVIVDQAVPPGSRNVTYQVQAVRSTGRGPVAEHTVNLGSVGRMASVLPARQRPPAMAA